MGKWRTLSYLPTILLGHSPKWFATLVVAFLGGAGLFSYYPNFRLQYGQWVADHLMLDLPQEISFWHLSWVLVAWIVGSLIWSEAKRRQVAPCLEFSDPFVWSTGLGPDAPNVVSEFNIDVISIKVKNRPLNMENGRGVTQAHCHAIFQRVGEGPEKAESQKVEDVRWTQAPKPRIDETPSAIKAKFKYEMNFLDIPPNDSWRQIDFAVSKHDAADFFGFPAEAQTRKWMDARYRFKNGKYIVEIIVIGNGLATPAKERIYLTKQADGDIKVESIMIRDAIDLGAMLK